ncbi:hypothetical protein ACYST1_19360 [Priestia megaterium]
MKEYTVSEAALILSEKRVIRRDKLVNRNKNGATKSSTGEPQVRLWIRQYNKVYKQEYDNCIMSGDSVEKARNFAHTKASRFGIRANIQSKKMGYRISQADLNDFIQLKIGTANEEKLIAELKTLKERKLNYKKEDTGVLENELYVQGYEECFQDIITYLNKRSLLTETTPSKKVIQLPKKGWFLNKDAIFGKEFRLWETNQHFILNISFINKKVPHLDFKMNIYSSKHNDQTSTELEWGLENATLSIHYFTELETLISNKNYIEIIKDILIEQIPSEDENRLAILMMLSR